MTGSDLRAIGLAYDRDSGVSDRLLWQRLSKATNAEDFAATWLALQARMLQGAKAGVLILGQAETGPFMPVALYPHRGAVGADLSLAAETALGDRKGVVRERPAADHCDASHCIAFPILVDGELHGVAAFELDPRGTEALSEAGRRLQWGSAWIEAMIRRRSFLPNQQLVEVLDIVASVMEAPTLSVALQSLSGEMARVLKAEWAAFGLLRNGTHVHVETLSQAITTSRKQEIVGAAAAAMQEAFDQRSLIRVPEDKDDAPLVTRAHRGLAEQSAAGGVVSTPVVQNGTVIGVLLVVAGAETRFSALDLDFCRLVATMAGPAIDLKRRDDRWIGLKVADALQALLSRLVGPRHTSLKLAALALVVAAAYLSVGTAPYRVTAVATVEGLVQRAVVVPIAGYIAAQGPRAGDKVAKGDILAKLDDREFRIERTRWTSEREQRLNEYRSALAGGERSRIQILKAQIEQSQAHIDLLDDQIARVELRAPIDGLVVRGDLSQSLGAPVQRGEVLFEIAPLDDYRIILKVDERDADAIKEGQRGDLILSSLSSLVLPLRITKLTPVSTAEEGRNFFRVEAALERGDPAVRPGMQGYGKITIDRRNVTAIAGARLMQWLRMTLWRFRF